jgi:hypothetical protein
MRAHPVLTAAALALGLSACASIRGHACRRGEHSVVRESLGFGTAKPNGMVTPAEWDAFLKSTVTPRFPQGLVVLESAGQWRGADGTIVREPSHLLILDHADDAASENAVREIIAAYKTRFQQEAVFRARSRACVSF